MEGVIWRLYRESQRGLIRGKDGQEVEFRRASLDGVEFKDLHAGLRVCYRVQMGWFGPEAAEIQKLDGESLPTRHR